MHLIVKYFVLHLKELYYKNLLVNIPILFYNNNMRIEEKIAELLTRQKMTLSIAESCSGGLLANRITNVPGSSAFFKLGVITYSDEAKIKVLKVSSEIIKKHGAVSEEIAGLMAKGVRALQKTDLGIAITGIAGPTSGSKKKPVGLTYIAINTELENLCVKCLFKGSRTQIKTQAATLTLEILLDFLNG